MHKRSRDLSLQERRWQIFFVSCVKFLGKDNHPPSQLFQGIPNSATQFYDFLHHDSHVQSKSSTGNFSWRPAWLLKTETYPTCKIYIHLRTNCFLHVWMFFYLLDTSGLRHTQQSMLFVPCGRDNIPRHFFCILWQNVSAWFLSHCEHHTTMNNQYGAVNTRADSGVIYIAFQQELFTPEVFNGSSNQCVCAITCLQMRVVPLHPGTQGWGTKPLFLFRVIVWFLFLWKKIKTIWSNPKEETNTR